MSGLLVTPAPPAPAPVSESGTCRLCGCTELRACADPHTGLGCHWVDDEQTVCNVCALLSGGIVFTGEPCIIFARGEGAA